MRNVIIVALLVAGLSSCAEEANTFTPPKIDNFDIRPDGEILVYGKGMEVLRKFNPSYEFSLGFHEYLPETDFRCIGNHVLVVNDSTLIINPDKMESLHMLVRYPDSLSPEIRTLISEKPIVAGQGIDLKSANARKLFSKLSKSDQDCAMWLIVKDKDYQFWDTKDPSRSSFTIGFYRIWRLQNINEAGEVSEKSYRSVKS